MEGFQKELAEAARAASLGQSA